MKKIKIGDYLIIFGAIAFIIGVLAAVIGGIVELFKTGGYSGFVAGIIFSGIVIFFIGLLVDEISKE